MASVNPFVPGVEINQTFAQATAAELEELSAFILGSEAHLVRYSEATEKAAGALGGFVRVVDGQPAAFNSYSYPERPVGGIIDTDYTKVHVDKAFLQYFNEPAGTFVREGLNSIKHNALNFASNTASYPASPVFGDREVKVGDRVLISGELSDTTPFSLATYVKGISGEPVGAAIGTPTAASTNAPATSLDVTAAPGGSNTSDTTITGDGAAYDGLADGRPTETYLLEVTQASTGGDITTARLRVTSSSGTDDISSLQPAAHGVAFAVGTRGLTVTLASVGGDDLAVGETFTVTVTQAHTLPTLTMGGSYQATDQLDRTYIIEVLSGETIANGPRVRVTTAQGTDASEEFTLTEDTTHNSTAINVGAFGITLSFEATTGLFTGDRWVVEATAAKPTNLRILELGHSLPETVAYNDVAAQLDVTLYIVDDIELPRRATVPGNYNWESTDTEFNLYNDILVEHPEWTVSGSMVPIPLVAPQEFTNPSQVFLTYRAWIPMDATIKSISSSGDLDMVTGPIHPDNPLKYALSKALTMNGGHPVYYFNVGNPSVHDGWVRGLALAEAYESTYGVVPLTRDSAVLDLVAAHVNSMSGPKFNRFRVAWFTDVDRTQASVMDASNSDDSGPVLVTITDNPNQSGSQYTLVTLASGNADFETLGVRPNDRLRFSFAEDAWGDVTYDEYVIDSVVNGNTLVLVNGPALPESTAKKAEIHRTLTPGERVLAFQGKLDSTVSTSAEAGNTLGQTPGYLIRYLPFSHVMDGSWTVESYFMAAGLAALRSALAPHQAMTRYPISGFTKVVGIDDFTIEQLNSIAASGGFIVAPSPRSGALIVRHGVTAGDWDNVNTREESIISNAHSIALYLFDILDPYIGQSNVTDATMIAIQADLDAAKRYLQSANYTPALGGQIIDFEITEFRPSPTAKDTFLLQGEALVAGPTNRIRFDLLIR